METCQRLTLSVYKKVRMACCVKPVALLLVVTHVVCLQDEGVTLQGSIENRKEAVEVRSALMLQQLDRALAQLEVAEEALRSSGGQVEQLTVVCLPQPIDQRISSALCAPLLVQVGGQRKHRA